MLEGCPVTNIVTKESTFQRKSVVAVETPFGSIKTKHVVNCTGVWANYIAAMVCSYLEDSFLFFLSPNTTD